MSKLFHFYRNCNYINIDFFISKNLTSSFELEIFPSFICEIFSFSIAQTAKTDHAGFKFQLSLCKLIFLSFEIRDNRHWDYENNCWQNYN